MYRGGRDKRTYYTHTHGTGYIMALSKQMFKFNDETVEVKFIRETDEATNNEVFWFGAKDFAKNIGYCQPERAFDKISTHYRRKYDEFKYTDRSLHPRILFLLINPVYLKL
ncbi:Baculovirus repeated ORF 6 [Trabala vishnou gigantina nucleopolyhedrovirus]|uniref:Baculovirus repeated ORF 6 n=1 Tax=Trabala vishnou gigantina nucleopolyhedrovirus TaxID=2863583 RepID=UPI002481E2C9|nr:Baculovirus repeated ORF 6 [Trabala vishnou gigantina nucleopolyhedrovirus]QYC92770.1 Baculovirus repeated ORF 6 [Trabala vishnou gigantina nucleopolyhedrovirus]